jgi:hypothetical protein
MSRHALLLLPLLALAACGGNSSQDNGQPGSEAWARNLVGNQGSPSFRRPDGSFDRADYRRVMIPSCAGGMHEGNPSIPAAEIERFCSCAVERMLATSSDAELFAMNRDSALQQRKYGEAEQVCLPASAGGRGGSAAGEEPPPPEEPAPSLNAGLPPPIVQEPPPRR